MNKHRFAYVLILIIVGVLPISGCSNIEVRVEKPAPEGETVPAIDVTEIAKTSVPLSVQVTSTAGAPPATSQALSTPAAPASATEAVAEGVKLYLGTETLSTDPPTGNIRFECYGQCSFTWALTLDAPLQAQSYGYRLGVTKRFHLRLTLLSQGRETTLVEALRLASGSPTQGTLGGQTLIGVPGDVLILELTLPDGGNIVAHMAGDALFGGGGSASFITLSSAEPPPSPTPAPVVGAHLSASRETTAGPAICAGPDDVLHVAWADNDGDGPAIFYARSADGGVSFSDPVVVAEGDEAQARGAPSIAGGPAGTVALAWEEKLGDTWIIAFSRSTDGTSFSSPAQAGAPNGTGDRVQPAMAARPDGTLYLAWRDLSVGETGGIFFAQAPPGNDFGTSVEVSPFPETQSDPVIAIDKLGRVHLAWTDRRDGPTAIYYARADDGISFDVLKPVPNTDGDRIPSLALDREGGVHLAWASSLLYVYHTHYAVSLDGGDTFSPSTMVNDGGQSVSLAPPATAVGVTADGTTYVAFRTDSPRDGKVIHYDRRTEGRFGRDITVAGGKEATTLSRPAMASDSQGHVFLAWGDSAYGPFQVYVARAEGGGTFDMERISSPTSGSTAASQPQKPEPGATATRPEPASTATSTLPSPTLTPTPGTDYWVSLMQGASKMLALAVSPDYVRDRTVFAGTGWGDVLRSEDGGDTWDTLDSGTKGTAILALAVSPNYASDRTLLAGTGTAGVFRSTDGGNTWEDVNKGIPNPKVPALAISPNYVADKTVFAGTGGGGVACSTDGGNTWKEMNRGLPRHSVEALVISPDYANDGTLFASIEGSGPFHDEDGGVFRSTDRGETWEETNTGLRTPWVKAMAVSTNYANDATVFVGTESALFRSTDGGDTWEQITFGLCVDALATSPIYSSDRTVFLSTMSTVSRSEDGGDSWVNLTAGEARPGGKALAIAPNYSAGGPVFASMFGRGLCKLVRVPMD